MDIQTTKLELLKAILDNENSEFIQRVSDFVKKEKDDFWNELSMSEQKEIKEGIADLDNGKRISYDSFFKENFIVNESILIGTCRIKAPETFGIFNSKLKFKNER